MNTGYAPPRNPPPPPPAGYPPASSPGGLHPSAVRQQQQQQQQQRRPVQVPNITTSVPPAQLFGSHLQPGTPASPRVGQAPSSPLVQSTYSTQASPPMASVRAQSTYNPQEWRRGGPVNGSYMPHSSQSSARRAVSTRDATGMEAFMPSPPPPYSPAPQSSQPSSRSVWPSPNAGNFSSSTTSPSNYNSEHVTPISATTSVSSGGIPSFYRANSVERISNTVTQNSPSSVVAPPPTTRDRSTSRSRFMSALSSLHRNNHSSSSNYAIESLQQQTAANPPQYIPHQVVPPVPVVPPSARRAASTGAIQNSPTPFRTESPEVAVTQSPEQVNHGFALPPPPPGPPPGGRSMSLNRATDRAAQSGTTTGTMTPVLPASVAARTAAMRRSDLGPIPPTPADWVEEEQRRQPQEPAPPVPTIPSQHRNASNSRLGAEAREPHPDPLSSNPPAAIARDPSIVRGIRERRSDSRASREPSASRERRDGDDQAQHARQQAKPADLVLQPSATGALSRRRHVSKAKISPLLDGSRTSPQLQRHRKDSDGASSSQPGSASLPMGQSTGRGSMPSTPFSSGHTSDQTNDSPQQKLDSQQGRPSSSRGRALEGLGLTAIDTTTATRHRPVSHAAYPPLDEKQAQQAIQSPPSSSKSLPGLSQPDQKPTFAGEALARHAQFIAMESKATSDEERLQLFADFIVHESRLRRDRYSTAFDSLGSAVLELTRDMWRPYQSMKKAPQVLPSIDTALAASPPSPAKAPPTSGSDLAAEPSSATSTSVINSDAITPDFVPASPIAVHSPMVPRPRATPRNPYQPMLSPIQSMAMSTVIDDSESSRGRSASRWWETSTDANSVGGARRVERTKWEAKYMGLSKEARENLQWESIPEDSSDVAGSSQNIFGYGPNEYPPEKMGWHEEPEPHPNHVTRSQSKAPEPQGMDVSRLVTLPPPYPRHHPAVNNKHPDLGSLRSILRSLNARDEVKNVRLNYDSSESAHLPDIEQPTEIADRRKKFRRSVQERVGDGSMSFAEAAQAEADFDANEAKKGRDQAQRSFDHFQGEVIAPLNKMFNEGINKAGSSIEQLSDSLSYEAQSHNPNQTQEEGDEKPELLEKLTLMKWFHEAREQLYKEMYNLEGESDERYKTLILLPYRQAGNEEKVHEVESFFDKDKWERRVKYEKEALKRYEELLRTTEQHVTRGAEVQLSAFWDIAPELLAVITRVPGRLQYFEVLIPPDELEENPNYREWPTQYLYSLLLHTEKSAYQFIEAQTNLLCLLHEVKSAVMNASSKLMQTQRIMEGEGEEEVAKEMKEIRKGEDTSLTADLKERVGLVEEQWRQALGKGLEECKDRIKVYLFESGGWDESLEE